MATSQDDVDVRVKLKDAARFQSDAQKTGKSIRGMGSNADKTSGSFRSASKSSGLFRKALGGLTTVGITAAGAGLVGLTGIVIDSTKGWAEHMGVVRRTRAVIKSTSGAANISAKGVTNLSDALERQTGVDGDLIQSGANMLLTFTNVRNGVGKNNKVFDQATSTLVGMSQAMGNDPKKAAIQLGKALNDPVKGITALSRVGVTFTDQQKSTIASLVKSGKTMEAQKIILGELNKEFPKVKATPFERLMVSVRALQDSLGKALMPIVNKAVVGLTHFLDGIQNGVGVGGAFASVVAAVGSGIGKALTYFKSGYQDVRKLVQGFKEGKVWAIALTAVLVGIGTAVVVFQAVTKATKAWAAAQVALDVAMNANPITLVITAIVALSAALFIVYKKSATFRNIVNSVWGAIKRVASAVGGTAVDAFKLLWTILKHTPLGFVLSHLRQIISFVGKMPGKISSAATGLWDGIKTGLVSALNWAIDKLNWLIKKANKIPGVNIGLIGQIAADLDQGPNGKTHLSGTSDAAQMAKGGTVGRSGLSWVGEEGPELLNMTRGAQVIPLSAEGGGATFHIKVVMPDGKVLADVVKKHNEMQGLRKK